MNSSRSSTPKKRKQHRRGASEMGKLFMTLFEDRKKTPLSRTTAQDAEELTREERLSRMLHTPKPKVCLPKNVPLFEHFIVVGLSNHTAKEPSVLFHYPSTPVGIPGVEDFCFPTGVTMEVMKATTCKSNLMEVRHNQDYLKFPDRSFVFLLTNEDSTVYYGICVHKRELLEDAPYYMDGPLIPEKFHAATTRCYCLITKYPFFRLHLDLLHSLFAVEHLTRLVEEAPTCDDLPVVRLPSGGVGGMPPFKRSTTVSSLSRSADLRLVREGKPTTRATRLQRGVEPRSTSALVDLAIRNAGSTSAVRPVSPTAVVEYASRNRVRSIEKEPAFSSPKPSRFSSRQVSDMSNSPSTPPPGKRGRDYRYRRKNEPCEEREEDEEEGEEEEAEAEGEEEQFSGEEGEVCTAPDDAEESDEFGNRETPTAAQAATSLCPDVEEECEEEDDEQEEAAANVQVASAAEPADAPRHGRTKSPLEELTSLEELESSAAAHSQPSSPLQRCKAARTRSHSQPVKMRPLRPGDPNHPAIDALERYRTTPVPEKGQTLAFETSVYLNRIQFTRPYFDEEEEIFAEWGLPITFFTLSISNICHLLSSILLERKVVLLSSNIRYLSALVLSFPPLIRPFLYQSVIIPALPVKMHNFLDAPVPFVVGLTQLPDVLPDDIIVVNVDKNKVIAKEPIPRLPGYKDLLKKCSIYHDQLKKTFGKSPPFATTKEQMSLVDSLSTVFETFFTKMFTNFHNYTMRNLTDPSKPISVFMKDAFLFDHPHESFLTPFVETQVFFDYQDKRLRKRDKFKLPPKRDIVF